MRASWHIALSALSGRPARTVLLAGAVMLASAMVTAVACGFGSGQRSVQQRIERLVGGIDARIIDENGNRFDATVLKDVQDWPDVRMASGRLSGSITLINRAAVAEDGRPRRTNVNMRGADPEAIGVLGDVELREGRLPTAADEIVIDPLSSAALEAAVGDRVTLQRFGAPMDFVVVGIEERPQLGMMQRASGLMHRSTLEEALGRRDTLTSVAIALEPGTDVADWCVRMGERLEPPLLVEPAELVTTGFDRQVRASRLGFVLAAAIAFLSCAFIVGTGMTTAVVEQQRLMGVMRSLGATRGQLFGSQLLVGVVTCGAGGLLGVPLGIALAWLLLLPLREVVPSGLVVEPLGIVLSLSGALLAGVVGALYPAWRAARVSPLEAMAAVAAPPTRRGLILVSATGIGCLLAQLLLVAALPDPQMRFWAYATVGLPLAHVGWFLLSVPLLVLVSAVASAPVARLLRVPVGILRGTIGSTPFRHGLTAGALMVGISILVSSWSNGLSLLGDWVDRIRFADGFAFRATGLSVEEQQRLAALPLVTESCAIGYLPVRIDESQQLGVTGLGTPNIVAIGFDTLPFFAMNELEWAQGDPATAIPQLLSGDGVLVAEQFLTARGLGVGDTLRIGTARGMHDLEIVGVVGAAGLDIATQWFGIRSAYLEHAISCVFMDLETLGDLFGSREATMMQFNLAAGVDDDEMLLAVTDAVPGTGYASGRFIREMIDRAGAAMLATSSAVALAALLLGCFGVGQVIAAGIHARRQEFGILLAVGAPRSLLTRLVCAEAILIGIAAACAGTLLGLQLASMGVLLYRDLLGLTLTLVIPWWPMIAGWVTVIALATLAAMPAAIALGRRAPRELLAGRG